MTTMAGIFSTLSVARSALLAQEAAIQTIGQNIANAGTEGYTRQKVELVSAKPQDIGNFSIGTGVEISRIERILDQQLEATLRDAGTSLNNLQTKSTMLGRIETVLNDLEDQGIGPAIERFFEALNDLSVTPEDHTLRREVVAAADALSDSFAFAADNLQSMRTDFNDELLTVADEINRMAEEVAQLNEQIVLSERGGQDPGTANDLRDRRDLLVKKLAERIDLTAVETSTGAVNISVDGSWLVFGQEAATITSENESADNGQPLHSFRFSTDGREFTPTDGSFGALLELRDTLVPGFQDSIDTVARTLAGAVNSVHAQGEGLKRFTELLSVNAAHSPTAALNQAGLPFDVTDGQFTLNVQNENTGHRDHYTISVNLSDPDAAMNLQDLAAAVNSQVAADHPGITARLTNDFHLELDSDSENITFGFEDDSSGVLNALGLNTFFTGSNAKNLGVNDLVRGDLDYFAAGKGNGVADNTTVLDMLALRDENLIENTTLEKWWSGRIGELGVERAQARELAENQQAIYENLANQREALSGVNTDEEAINLLQHQRSYQAAARLLSVVDSLVQTLLQAV